MNQAFTRAAKTHWVNWITNEKTTTQIFLLWCFINPWLCSTQLSLCKYFSVASLRLHTAKSKEAELFSRLWAQVEWINISSSVQNSSTCHCNHHKKSLLGKKLVSVLNQIKPPVQQAPVSRKNKHCSCSHQPLLVLHWKMYKKPQKFKIEAHVGRWTGNLVKYRV